MRMDVNFEYYKIFYYVAKYKNFTKAAHILESSQPNVTRAMNCLEQQINTTLFVRSNRGIKLTPEGERLYIRVSAAMTQILAAEEELVKSTSLLHGSVSIGASETALNIFLLDKLKDFHMVHPGIRLKIAHAAKTSRTTNDMNHLDFSSFFKNTPLTVYRSALLTAAVLILLTGTARARIVTSDMIGVSHVALTVFFCDLVSLLFRENVLPCLDVEEPVSLCITHVVVKLLVIDYKLDLIVVINSFHIKIIAVCKAGLDTVDESYEYIH